MTPYDELMQWYRAQCDGDWEHSWGIRIETLDNPGWRVEIDLTDTLLEDKAYQPISLYANATEWLECTVREGKFIGAGDPDSLSRIVSSFVAWAKSELRWLDAPSTATLLLKQDDKLYAALGEEVGPKLCNHPGCTRLRIRSSVKCRDHHFAMIRGYPPDT